MHAKGEEIDVITFAGNGEPTTHAHFAEIVDDCITLRDNYMPKARLSVLSNATMLWKKEVVEALKKIDNNILKLDSAIESTARIINQPQQPFYSVEKTINGMMQFDHKCIIQTMFLRGSFKGQKVDNTTPEEIDAWVEAVKKVMPQQVQLYSIDRKTPVDTLIKVEGEELQTFARRIKDLGIETIVTY